MKRSLRQIRDQTPTETGKTEDSGNSDSPRVGVLMLSYLWQNRGIQLRNFFFFFCSGSISGIRGGACTLFIIDRIERYIEGSLMCSLDNLTIQSGEKVATRCLAIRPRQLHTRTNAPAAVVFLPLALTSHSLWPS